MAANHTTRLVRHLQATADEAEPTDGQLLGGFVERRDEGAFAALVSRHAPMVWGVCRRALDRHDAEDAFQATFLVLVRKAAAVVPRELVGRWLYGVAHKTALQARRAALKRARAAPLTETPAPGAEPTDPWQELLPLLDEAISLLPEKYRAVVVLCDLGGKTRKEVARQLGVPEGTVAGRLARARALLAKRLARRGGLLSGALAALLSERAAPAGAPGAVVSATLKAAVQVAAGRAAGLVSPPVVALTEGVLKAMLLHKVKNVVLALVVTAAATTAAGGVVLQAPADPPTTPGTPALPQPGGALPAPPVASKASLPDARLPSRVELPQLESPPRPAASLTPEELRARYVKLHEELAPHLSDPVLVQRVTELEQQLAAAKERQAKAAREKQAADELAAAQAALAKIAATYGGTDAGAKAKQALDVSNLPVPRTEPLVPSSSKADILPLSLPSPNGSDSRKK